MSGNSNQTKERILKAGRTLYSMHGFDGTTMEDILTASAITKGAFYHHFKSKEALCHAVLDEVIGDYQALAESIDPDLEPIEQLRQMITKLAQLNSSGEWVNCRLMLRFSSDSHETHPKIKRKVRNFWQWQHTYYEELIEKCRGAGQLTNHLDANTQTNLIIATIAGTIIMEKNSPSTTPLADLVEIVIHSLTP